MQIRHPQLSGKRVLIVEDEMLIAMEVEDLLADQGCEVLPTAPTVEYALQHIDRDRPELVVLDRNLDGVGTTPVAEKLNSSGIPFLILTGYTHGVAGEPALANAPCLQKPWNQAELLRQLSGLVK